MTIHQMRQRCRDRTGAIEYRGTTWLFVAACFLLFASACNRGEGNESDAGEPDTITSDGDVETGPRDGVAVMTWNLEEFPLASGTISLVADITNNIHPDLLAIQEIQDPDDFETLANALPDYQGIVADDPGAYMVVGLLYRTDTVNIGHVETLFRDDGWAFPRPPLAVWLTARDGGDAASFDMLLVVVHLKARLDEESQGRRQLACERLEAWIAREVSGGSETDIVILGDWNDELLDPPEWNVFGAFLDRPDQYTFLTMELAEGGDYTYLPFESFIDHIMVTNDALEEYGEGTTDVLELERVHSNYQEVVSDHRPVLSRFQVP